MNEPGKDPSPDKPESPPDPAQAPSRPAVELPPPGDSAWYEGPGLRIELPDL